MTSRTAKIAPIVKTRILQLEQERAFALFTERTSEWWPLATHSIAGAQAVGVEFEGRVGGRVLEVTADGTRHSWADVEVWEPPRRFVLSWHAVREPVAASTLEVRFDTVEGGTRVTLEHHGWEAFGTAAADLRSRYDSGWDVVLGALPTHLAG